jgi:acetolactate synthase-1/2/3 large subunit
MPSDVAAAFAHALHAAGVQRVYGLPGEDHLRLLDALPEAGLTYIAARDECSAATMAATEAQASGVPGVVLVTIAPGITNAVNAIAHAWLDHVPLLVVCGQHAPERAPVIIRQSLDTLRLVSPLARWTVTASRRIHQVLARALETSMAEPAGPVLLELRDDVAAAEALDRPENWPSLQTGSRTVRPRVHLSDEAIPPEPSQQVRHARCPTIVVGGACPNDPETRQAIARASEALAAPVLCSPAAMGVLGPDHPWFAGTFMNGNLEADLLGRSDLIVTLGLDARDFFNAAWRYSAPILAINARPDTQRFAPTQQQLIGDTAAILDALARGGSASTVRPPDVTAYRASVERPFDLDAGAFTIPAALRAARALLPPETLVAVDAGFGKPLASYLWSSSEPNTYFTAHGLSTMGYALPAAIALQLSFAERPVIGFMGDGSLLMRASELSVAAEQFEGVGHAPIFVAWMDGALAQIETKQVRQGLQPVGARVPKLECASLAAAFGACGLDVHSLNAFSQALEDALSSGRPTLVGAHVDQSRRAEWYELLRG